jgi:hypothetical protein
MGHPWQRRPGFLGDIPGAGLRVGQIVEPLDHALGPPEVPVLHVRVGEVGAVPVPGEQLDELFLGNPGPPASADEGRDGLVDGVAQGKSGGGRPLAIRQAPHVVHRVAVLALAEGFDGRWGQPEW